MFIYTGQDDPKLPSIRKTDEEITGLLRMVNMPMVGGYQDVAKMLDKPWPAYIEGDPELLWRPTERKQPPVQQQPQGKNLRRLPGKYSQENGPHDLSSPALVNTPVHLRPRLLAILNSSKAYRTWKGESSTGRHVLKIEQDHGLNLDFPWSVEKASNYIVASSLDGLAASTILVYVSRVRSLHSRHGLQPAFTIKQVANLIKGAAQVEAQPESAVNRICITPELMKYAKDFIDSSRRPDSWKALIWMLFCWCWLGAFRSDDLIHDSPSAFCPETSLLKNNVHRRTDYLGQGRSVSYLKVWIPSPKHKRGSGGVWVELLPTLNWFCPVGAFTRYLETSESWEGNLPLVHRKGALYTKAEFNRDLKLIFKSKIDFASESITSHSFRAGVISALARAGASEDLLKSQTDHSSSAYQSYLKLGRSSRLSQQAAVISTLEDLANNNFGYNNLLVD